MNINKYISFHYQWSDATYNQKYKANHSSYFKINLVFKKAIEHGDNSL